MSLVVPNWNQPRPTAEDVLKMCRTIRLTRLELPTQPFDKFLTKIRSERGKGGAYLKMFDVGPDLVFDWFASRNRLWDERLLDWLVLHPAIAQSLPEIRIPDSPDWLVLHPAIAQTQEICLPDTTGFGMFDPFLHDGTFATLLYHGGAYTRTTGDGQAEKELAVEVCKAMFGLRYGEIVCNTNYGVWTPWFKGIAWDMTVVIFDRSTRKLWMFVTTDAD